MLYPTVDLDRVDDAFRHGLELMEAVLLVSDVLDMDHSSMQNWMLPARCHAPNVFGTVDMEKVSR